MNNTNALIILDWDDTLFPTSWVIRNNINLNDMDDKNKYIVFFSELDNILYKLLQSFTKYGTVVIVTNAMVKWVGISSTILPNTKRLIDKNIRIISAREEYQKEYPGDMFAWKRSTFRDIVTDYYGGQDIQNIISAGDADYEFQALVDLWNTKNNKRILKSIKLMRSPTYESLIDQLNVLYKSVTRICTNGSHMDLRFNSL
jgi:hypothetical protein